MLHKWLEEWENTVLFLGLLSGLMIVWLCYWKGQYQVRYAETVLQEFLTETAVDGKITLEDYEKMMKNIGDINPNYKVNLVCRKYRVQPLYALIPEEDLVEYYTGRNVKREIALPDYKPCLDEEAVDLLCLQTETNATIMAAEQNKYLPLPEENLEWSAEAVYTYQEVYEGERLITVCSITSEHGNCYVEAEPVVATESGTIVLQLSYGERKQMVPVEVLCHPRTVVCEFGHEVVNSRQILEESKRTGKLECPYCGLLPEYIVCNTAVLSKETGDKFRKDELWLTAAYPDGHTEQVTPESKDWADTYDENYCGIQQVTVNYRGAEAAVMVISENKGCRQCNAECNERCYADYIRFPYCTECMSRTALFTGKVQEEEQILGLQDLVCCLDEKGELLLKRGDFVTAALVQKGQYLTLLQREVMQDGGRGAE